MRHINDDSAEMIARFATFPMEVQRRLIQSVDADATTSKSAGLYKTGTDILIRGWHDLIQTGTITMSGTAVTKCSSQIPIGDLLLSNGVSTIGPRAFEDITSLTGVIFPPSIVDVRNDAFSGCDHLGSVTMQNSVTHIGANAFAGCVKLSSVIIPPSVRQIAASAFAGCSGMAYAILGSGLKSIGPEAFANCTGLARIYIPTNVEEIAAYPFKNCTGLAVFCAVPEALSHWRQEWNKATPETELPVTYAITRPDYEATIIHPAGNPENGGK